MQFPQSLNRSQLPLFEAFLGTHLPLLDEAVQSPWLDEPEPFSELRLSGSLGNCRHLLGPVLRELSLTSTTVPPVNSTDRCSPRVTRKNTARTKVRIEITLKINAYFMKGMSLRMRKNSISSSFRVGRSWPGTAAARWQSKPAMRRWERYPPPALASRLGQVSDGVK